MTDKQIIIDGVDVQNCDFFEYCDIDVEFSKCLAHWHHNEDYSDVCYAHCDAYPNCHYKRMMHTGAELNIHKTDKEHAYKRIAELQEQLKRKEQECKRLKEKIAEISKISDCKTGAMLALEGQLDQLQASLDEKNDFLQKLGISATGEFKRIKYYIDKLVAENEELKKQLMQKSEVDMFFNTPIEGWSNDPCGVCKYKQTLTEINECLTKNAYKGWVSTSEIDDILQKISEVVKDE